MYKQKNNLPVFQSNREVEIINKVRNISPDELKNSSEVLFNNIMDISKCRQQQELYKDNCDITFKPFTNDINKKIGCQGTTGAYSHIAAKKLFPENNVEFYNTFEDVFIAVENGELDFGILPIQNSTAGSVALTYELMKKYNFYISANVSVKISHCLAVKKGTDIKQVKA